MLGQERYHQLNAILLVLMSSRWKHHNYNTAKAIIINLNCVKFSRIVTVNDGVHCHHKRLKHCSEM